MSACTLYFQKLESLAYIFVADIIQISAVGFKRRIFLQQSVLAIQGHPRSMILVPIEVRI